MKRFISVLLCIIMLMSFCIFGEAQTETNFSAFLKVENGYLTDGKNKNIVLNGINLGNWLLQETWMGFIPEYEKDWGYYDTLEVLNNRFSPEEVNEIINSYECNFITEADIKNIKDLGFNCVRVPFWYRNFMDENGEWLTEMSRHTPGFIQLDWLIEECAKNGIYVILDMHGAPGGQSKNHCTGKAGRNELYENEHYQELTCKLWKEIAERYKDCTNIAAYDLLNEPQNNSGYEGENSWQAETSEAVERTNKMYKMLYDAVRNVDDNHIISFEGIWSTDVLPNVQENGYENIMFQLHLYDKDKGMIKYRIKELKKVRKQQNVAVLVGEYNNGENEAYANKNYVNNDISFIKWNYKTFNAGEQWGIYNKNTDRIDIKTASYEEILNAFSNVKTDTFTFNEAEYNIISNTKKTGVSALSPNVIPIAIYLVLLPFLYFSRKSMWATLYKISGKIPEEVKFKKRQLNNEYVTSNRLASYEFKKWMLKTSLRPWLYSKLYYLLETSTVMLMIISVLVFLSFFMINNRIIIISLYIADMIFVTVILLTFIFAKKYKNYKNVISE